MVWPVMSSDPASLLDKIGSNLIFWSGGSPPGKVDLPRRGAKLDGSCILFLVFVYKEEVNLWQIKMPALL